VKRALAALFLAGCAHGDLRQVSLLVSPDVMTDDLAHFADAQVLRSGLVLELHRGGYCLDRAGDFEAMLQLRTETAGGDLRVFLTLDTARGARVDEVEHTWRTTRLPSTPAQAAGLLRPLLRELAQSQAARDMASDLAGCDTRMAGAETR